MNKIRILLRTSDNFKIGGVRQIYRHVDVLNQLGYDAAVIHPTQFKCSWFENNTKTVCFNDLSLDKNDCLVLPELDPDIPVFPGSDVCKIIVFAQNPYGLLKGFGGMNTLFDIYKNRVSSIICVSEHSRKHLQSLFPCIDVYRILYSFDKPPFVLGENKERLISFMPRRRDQEMNTVLNLLQKTGKFEGWNVVPIIDKSESEVADIMRRSAIFMASGQAEGFGMPAAEAMACGCFVVGWHGYGGEEIFKSHFSLTVPDGDVFHYVEAMRQVLSWDDRKGLGEIQRIGKKASNYIREEYSTEREIKSIKTAWGGIMGDKEIIMPEQKSVFPLNNVAAYMMANEENAYIERIIRWLSTRVGKIFIVEGEKSYSGSTERDMQVQGLINRLLKSGVTNIEHIIAKFAGFPNPAINETIMRNEALDSIQKQGFEWVWIVDSDEVYSDAHAEELWKFFLENTQRDKQINGARCFWYTYWRSIHWRIDPPESYIPNIIISSACRFSIIRALADERNILTIPREVCMVRHYSWAKAPSEIEGKIKGWGHAHQVLPGWYENVFSKWEPGCSMENLHPTEPSAYRKAVRCQLPMPELMTGHPYSDLDLIDCDDHSSPNIKVIIINHNKPENSDKLFEQLSKAFDVEIWDSGSSPDKIPIHVSKSFPNIYWTGIWNVAMTICSEYDVVWVIGCDIELKSEPIEYRNAIEASMPFGCWSPCIEGRAHPFMQADNYKHGEPISVKNIEGMALAVSGELMRKAKKLVEGSDIGFGQDFWLCHMARKNGMKNIIDGRVKLFHPEGIGYDEQEALRQMNESFSKLYGDDFRRTIFEYDERYTENIMTEEITVVPEVLIPEVVRTKPLTIVTVDNGWGYAEFLRITSNFPVRRIVMLKGAAELSTEEGVEVIKYDPEMKVLLENADIALFPKVGAANKEEYIRLLQAGIPVVVNVAFHLGVIEHMKNGFYYQEEQWAVSWIKELLSNASMRKEVKERLLANPPNLAAANAVGGCSSCAEKAKALAEKSNASPMVTVITPTYHRDSKIISRCIDCMKLQTVASWEHLVCSDGEEEEHAKKVVEEAADSRVIYCHTNGKKQGDFGNTVRSEMLKRARGKFVLFFDDDNIILPSYLAQMMKAITISGNADFAVCKIMHFGPLNEATGKPPIVLNGDPVKLYHIDPLQVLVKTEVMKSVGWDTEVGYLSDGVSLEKLGDGYKHTRVEEVLGIHV